MVERKKEESPKDKAIEIFNSCYFVLFTSDTDYSEECIVSILAIENAKVVVRSIIQEYEYLAVIIHQNEYVIKMLRFYEKVLDELDKM